MVKGSNKPRYPAEFCQGVVALVLQERRPVWLAAAGMVIPAPGSLAVLGLAGFMSLGRRCR